MRRRDPVGAPSGCAVERAPVNAHAGHQHAEAPTAKLRVAFFFSLAVLGLEVAGGLASNSLALLSDAGHVLTDVLAIALAWFASAQAERPPSARHTYGFHRAGILAALVNAGTLVALAAFITYEAYHRLLAPREVESGLMLIVALVGLAANLGVAWFLRSPSGTNLNVRAALTHVVGDALASAAVIVGAVAIALGGPSQIDPLLSILISGVLVIGSWSIARETLNILMEGAPPHVNVGRLISDLRSVPGVAAVHDTHVWRLGSEITALSVHVRLASDRLEQADRVLGDCQRLLQEHYGISHTTIQVEPAACVSPCVPPDAGAEADAYCTGAGARTTQEPDTPLTTERVGGGTLGPIPGARACGTAPAGSVPAPGSHDQRH